MSRDFSPLEFDDCARSLSDSEVRAIERDSVERNTTQETRSKERSVEPKPEERIPQFHFREGRAVLSDMDRGYRLTESEMRTATDLGKFRIIGTNDLAQHAYSGHREKAQKEIENLVRLGLARK